MEENYEKMRISIRYWLIGKGYIRALKAMEFAERYHTGKRKDGAHEFSHQVSQANVARNLIHTIRHPEELFVLIFLHDIPEDKGISHEEIESMFGRLCSNAIKLITKEYRGVKTPNDVYYKNMVECTVSNEDECALVSVGKGLDRVHNLMSMLGGFKPEKRMSYIQETLDFTIPMLKIARRRFPDQESAYEMIKFIMTNQIQLYIELNEKIIQKG